MTTYVGVRHIGQKRTTLVRTEESLQRASRRAMLRTPSFLPKWSAQEVADEKHLSRSKPYPNQSFIPGGLRRRMERGLAKAA